MSIGGAAFVSFCVLVSSCGCVTAANPTFSNLPIHVGKSVEDVDSIEIEARLVAFEEDAGFIDLVDGAIQFDVSKFVVEQPDRLCGSVFLVNHLSSDAADVWRHVGKLYTMSVYADIVEPGDIVVVAGPEFVTIFQVSD